MNALCDGAVARRSVSGGGGGGGESDDDEVDENLGRSEGKRILGRR